MFDYGVSSPMLELLPPTHMILPQQQSTPSAGNAQAHIQIGGSSTLASTDLTLIEDFRGILGLRGLDWGLELGGF